MSSSWAAFLPTNIAKHPGNFVGPNVAGTIVQAFETGILVNQASRFWSGASEERTSTKLLVSFVSLAACFQTCIAFYNTWRLIVLGFGEWGNVVFLQWPDRIQPILNCLMSAPFHAFLIRRCWAALQRRWIVLFPLAALLLASIVMNLIITVKVFNYPLSIVGTPFSPPPGDYVTAFVLQAVLDILITALMFWYLNQAKSQVVSRRFGQIVGGLLRMLWEAALPPCICAIAACVVYITMRSENLWDVFLQSIIGKLYVISLFVILNGRHDLKRDPPHHSQSAGIAQYWASGAMPEVRVHLTSIDEQVEGSEEMELTPTTEHSAMHVQIQRRENDKPGAKDDLELGSERRSAASMIELSSLSDRGQSVLRRSTVSIEPYSP